MCGGYLEPDGVGFVTVRVDCKKGITKRIVLHIMIVGAIVDARNVLNEGVKAILFLCSPREDSSVGPQDCKGVAGR